MKRTDISQIGKNAFIEQLIAPFGITADDAAIIPREEGCLELITTTTLLEGVDFDLQYTPLQHLGYKAVIAAISNIYAMNGQPEFLTVGLGLSTRFSVEEVEAIYEGVRIATERYGVKLIGGNTAASITGLTIALTAIGRTDDATIVRRDGAKETDLICISGNLGAAYMGLQLLEREKHAVGNSGITPQLEGYNYILQRQLKPEARKDIIETLAQNDILPSAMMDITKGLASAVLNLCQSSQCGARIYLERIPIAAETFQMAEELNTDPVVAALNGGDDFELLFTVPLAKHKEVLQLTSVDVIGHIVPIANGAALTTPDGSDITIQSPDFTARA